MEEMKDILTRIEAKLDRLLAGGEAPNPEVKGFSIKEAARVTGISASTIRRAVHRKELPASDLGNGKRAVWLITQTSLAAWIESRRRGGSPAPPQRQLAELVGRYFSDAADESGD